MIGQPRRMCWPVALALAAIGLAGCGGPLSLLTGGGPNVAANGNAGRVAVQSVGVTRLTENRVDAPNASTVTQTQVDGGVTADRVDQVTNNAAPVWLILVALAGWLLPSPAEMARGIRSMWPRGRRGAK